MKNEYECIKNYIDSENKNILSIDWDLRGLEIILNNNFAVKFFSFIERNFVTKKVRYGWDSNNNEVYNDLSLLNKFLVKNGLY